MDGALLWQQLQNLCKIIPLTCLAWYWCQLVLFSHSNCNFPGHWYEGGFLLHPVFIMWGNSGFYMNLYFSRLSLYLGLVHRSWTVGSSSSDILIFRIFVVLFWSAWSIWYCWSSQWSLGPAWRSQDAPQANPPGTSRGKGVFLACKEENNFTCWASAVHLPCVS